MDDVMESGNLGPYQERARIFPNMRSKPYTPLMFRVLFVLLLLGVGGIFYIGARTSSIIVFVLSVCIISFFVSLYLAKWVLARMRVPQRWPSRGEKAESSFRSMLQEEASSTNFQQEAGGVAVSSQDQWRHKIYPGSSEDSSITDFKQINRGLSLDQPQQFSSNMSGSNNHPNFQLDSSAAYGSNPNVLQGLLVSDNQQHQSMNYSYPISSYGTNTSGHDELLPSWSKFPQFLRTSSPPKQPPHHGQLHFSNNTPFWNASSTSMNDVRSSLFPSLQSQIPLPNFEEKPKNTTEARDLAITKKSSSNEPSNKRARNETPAPMPAFNVRKEKMGDRITAIQQLVSPFGKTDTASVLSEAIEYIKFLHEQVGVLSNPYMKSGAPMSHQQNPDKSKDPEGPKQDLRSRGLCLVPVSSTFPVTHQTIVDFWTPTFGGTFR